MYYENDGGAQTEEEIGNLFANVDDLGDVCKYLLHLIMQSGSHENKGLLNEIELFFRALAVKDHN